MEFVDRRTLSRHNPTPPSRDAATYPLRCGGNRRLAMVRQLSPDSIALASPSRVPHRVPQTTCAQKPLSCILPVAILTSRQRSDNNYESAHNQGGRRQKETDTAVDLSVNYEDYIACEDILARYNASSSY